MSDLSARADALGQAHGARHEQRPLEVAACPQCGSGERVDAVDFRWHCAACRLVFDDPDGDT